MSEFENITHVPSQASAGQKRDVTMSREGFVDATGAQKNWIVNGVVLPTRRWLPASFSVTADQALSGGVTADSGPGTYQMPSASALYAILKQNRVNPVKVADLMFETPSAVGTYAIAPGAGMTAYGPQNGSGQFLLAENTLAHFQLEVTSSSVARLIFLNSTPSSTVVTTPTPGGTTITLEQVLTNGNTTGSGGVVADGPIIFTYGAATNTLDTVRVVGTLGVPTGAGTGGEIAFDTIGGNLYYHNGTSWILVSSGVAANSLAAVLGVGQTTGGSDIVITSGDALRNQSANDSLIWSTTGNVSDGIANILIGSGASNSGVTAGSAIVLGTASEASNTDDALIIGRVSTIVGSDDAIALGRQNAITSSVDSVTLGRGNVVTAADNALNFGVGNTVTAANTITIGNGVTNNVADQALIESGGDMVVQGDETFVKSTNDVTIQANGGAFVAGSIILDSLDLRVTGSRQRYQKNFLIDITDADTVLTASQAVGSIFRRTWATAVTRSLELPTWANLNAELAGGFVVDDCFELTIVNDNAFGSGKDLSVFSTTNNIRRWGAAANSLTPDLNPGQTVTFIGRSEIGNIVMWYEKDRNGPTVL